MIKYNRHEECRGCREECKNCEENYGKLRAAVQSIHTIMLEEYQHLKLISTPQDSLEGYSNALDILTASIRCNTDIILNAVFRGCDIDV